RRLPDHDRPRADDQDGGDVGPLRHQPSGKFTLTNTALSPFLRAQRATHTRCPGVGFWCIIRSSRFSISSCIRSPSASPQPVATALSCSSVCIRAGVAQAERAPNAQRTTNLEGTLVI